MTINTILAIIADGGRGIVVIYREGVEINYFFFFILLILLKSFDGGLVQPFSKGILGVWYLRPSKPCRWRGKLLHHGGDVCVLVFS